MKKMSVTPDNYNTSHVYLRNSKREQKTSGRNSKLLSPINTGKGLLGMRKENQQFEMNRMANQVNIKAASHYRGGSKPLDLTDTLPLTGHTNVIELNKHSRSMNKSPQNSAMMPRGQKNSFLNR